MPGSEEVDSHIGQDIERRTKRTFYFYNCRFTFRSLLDFALRSRISVKDMASDEDEGFILRIRGLPWSATKEEILNFFGDCKIKNGVDGIHMTLSREGRPSGEAYIEMEDEEELRKGLDKNNEHMGHRYIEVFKSKRSEMEWVIKRSGAHQQDALNDGCVRLRGLPFGCSKEEIAQFFSGLEIVPNGITLPTDYQGRSTGEAYVQFASRDIAEKAMGKHKDKIGHRYIEIFKSSLQEVRAALGMSGPKMRSMSSSRPGPYDRNDRYGGPSGRYGMGRGSRNYRGYMDDDGYSDYGGSYGNNYGGSGFGSRGGRTGGPIGGSRYGGTNSGGNYGGNGRGYGSTGHCIHMRGLPFKAAEDDIYDFFRPFHPISVRLLYEDSGRPSGEADVEFATREEAVRAMSKDKAHMQHRYIELFLNSNPSPVGGSAGFGGGVGPIGSGGSMGYGGGMNSPMSGGGGNFASGRYGGDGYVSSGQGHMGGGAGGGSFYNSGMNSGMGGGMGSGYGSHMSGMSGSNYTAF